MLVDPNPENVELFLEALESERIANNIHTVSSGVEALDFLHQHWDYTDAPRPNLVLPDINLPQIDGDDMLKRLNESPKLAGIPVIVLTGSDVPEDQAKSYDLHANAYVQKPVDPEDFLMSYGCSRISGSKSSGYHPPTTRPNSGRRSAR